MKGTRFIVGAFISLVAMLLFIIAGYYIASILWFIAFAIHLIAYLLRVNDKEGGES